MRTFSTGVRRGLALLTLVIIIAVPAAYAADGPTADPQTRISPPGGLTSQEARINPRGGRMKSDPRISPVTSPEPSWFELFAEWLRAQVCIGPPIG